ncbi:MAG: hypothetical protein NTV63_03675 [Candidatus Woesearchaeota archaeon]|nr:hypothetical protein [Candidatus Woesearchaeota archaeon]
MKIIIDTEKDSEASIRSAIRMLSVLIRENRSSFEERENINHEKSASSESAGNAIASMFGMDSSSSEEKKPDERNESNELSDDDFSFEPY